MTMKIEFFTVIKFRRTLQNNDNQEFTCIMHCQKWKNFNGLHALVWALLATLVSRGPQPLGRHDLRRHHLLIARNQHITLAYPGLLACLFFYFPSTLTSLLSMAYFSPNHIFFNTHNTMPTNAVALLILSFFIQLLALPKTLAETNTFSGNFIFFYYINVWVKGFLDFLCSLFSTFRIPLHKCELQFLQFILIQEERRGFFLVVQIEEISFYVYI